MTVSEAAILKGVRQMKIDEHLLLGLLIGVIVGLNYGVTLVSYMPFFVIGVVFLIYKRIGAK